MKKSLFLFCTLVQWTWGLPQNILGLLTTILVAHHPRRFRGAIVSRLRAFPLFSGHDCFSLGMFILMGRSVSERNYRKLLIHEYGHTIQSLLFGPFFLPLIGLPSSLRRLYFKLPLKNRRSLYHTGYPEKQANELGEYFTGEKAIHW